MAKKQQESGKLRPDVSETAFKIVQAATSG